MTDCSKFETRKFVIDQLFGVNGAGHCTADVDSIEDIDDNLCPFPLTNLTVSVLRPLKYALWSTQIHEGYSGTKCEVNDIELQCTALHD